MFLSKILRAADHPYITQAGGRKANNVAMQGMTAKSLRHHKALQPLFVIIGAGMVFVGAYCFRLAAFTTDVNWTKNKEQAHLYDYYTSRRFKFLNPTGTDYSKFDAPPKYD
eukprot:TRINITY_DN789_c0_g1_i2.p1 TRINITY_DN789_c0_g1~~TRINITY_DN789_c0_g1_i2.p1  ORF type:complete len:111 (-),score=38.77 TRINITY_DN789_c0_g1_i2:588-920(-)